MGWSAAPFSDAFLTALNTGTADKMAASQLFSQQFGQASVPQWAARACLDSALKASLYPEDSGALTLKGRCPGTAQ